MNPNYFVDQDGKQIDPRIDTMEKHCRYVFKKYVIRRCQAEEIYIIAHSAGGRCLVDLFKKFRTEFVDNVKAVAFTDSSHKNFQDTFIDKEEENWVKEHCIHYVKSAKPLGSEVKSTDEGMMPSVSAGHTNHEYTTGSSWEEIQKFFISKAESYSLKARGYSCHSEKSYTNE
jgi:predicted alpha/beta hydrolase family esterase